MKSTLYLTATVLSGNKIEIETPSLSVGQTVEVVVLITEGDVANSSNQEQNLSLDQRRAFLKLPISQRRQILQTQAETMVDHYQENSEWQELMSGDIIDY